MVYFFYGADSFRIRQKLNSVIKSYRAKHSSGLNFGRFNFSQEAALDDFKNFIESCSMFAEKKLAVLENLFEAKSAVLEKFAGYIGTDAIFKDRERFLIIAQELKLNEDKKKKEKYAVFREALAKELFKKLTSATVNREEFDLLAGAKLENWIKKEIAALGAIIDERAVQRLAVAAGSDLWRLHSEIQKLASYKNGRAINEHDVENLVIAKVDNDIFKTIDALALRNQAAAFKFLHRNLAQGESEIYLLAMLIYQFRNLLLVKSQLEEGVPFYNLARKIKQHPFVLRKTFEQSKNFSLPVLKKVYERLAEIDLGVKSGLIEPRAALDLAVGEITS